MERGGVDGLVDGVNIFVINVPSQIGRRLRLGRFAIHRDRLADPILRLQAADLGARKWQHCREEIDLNLDQTERSIVSREEEEDKKKKEKERVESVSARRN